MKKIFLSALTAVTLVAAGCSKEHNIVPTDANSAVEVTIQSEQPAVRAAGVPTADQEKSVQSFTVYVFNNSTGVLEKSETFTGQFQGKVSGLSLASQKKVVVLVNRPDGFPAISQYADLSDPSAMIGLDTQVPGDFTTKGLFMSGEHAGAVTLSKDQTVAVTVKVKRVVAKVRLGSLTVTPDSGLSLDDFTLTGVSIQKARDKAPVFGGMATTGFGYIGGLDQGGNVVTSYLHEFYTLPGGYAAGTPLDPNVYFYVFPNDNTDNESTLMALYGEYNGGRVYFPFYINDKVGGAGETSDGTWLQGNKVYTVNVTLRKLGSGGEDPNVPNEQVSMDVNVEIADWEGELSQDVEW